MKAIIACLCLVLLGLCNVAEAQLHAYGTAARVNGVDISNEKLERNFEEYLRDNDVNIAAIRYPNRVTMMRQKVLDQLIDQEVIWQAAQQHELLATDEEVEEAMQQVRAQFGDEQDFIGRLAVEGFTVESYQSHVHQTLSAKKYMESATSAIEVSDAEVHEFYVDNPGKFQLAEGVRARHILLKLAQDADEETRDAVHDRAGDLLDRLLAGEDFASVAIEASEDASAAQGGDLGYFSRGKMVKPFDDAAFALRAGQMSGIVESQFGLHIIKVDDHQDAQTVAEEIAKERIIQQLVQAKRQQSMSDELAALRAAASIEVLVVQ